MNPRSVEPRRWPLTRLAALASVALVLLTGCQEVEEAPEASSYEPSSVQVVATGGKQVTFTAEAAERVDLTSVQASRSGAYVVVDYAALIYDGTGVPYVYAVQQPLVFQRKKVVVDRIEGGRVLLTGGLAAGTPVVTVGASEVYGAELDIAGSH